ncbi:hypothetical protein H8S77_19085 [Parabacteroides sp. BX2]|jgi:glycosyltransferase involved in cell wall biosynthesis|uniref:Glycosyltransferase family 2 protein n=1 Tax=Parabacteroides segnis TaxID=2763058 RepID=A0ABR7E5D5_9BACT|nr:MULTISPECIES: hypothetical protein [Parabacteroides]MBC5644987.1 hypothetical protein [Parabacteroides segnis]MCM0712690.1 hypothetical protein [Parabacteroides sp. TA-V-105]
MAKCTCNLCREGKYNSEDYCVDMSFLKKERPVGVSGLLRVKNDAEFLSDCIESCIDALDELIICYQDCTDNAPEIIREKQQKYPDKIKVYYYAPPVLCHGLTEEEKKYVFSLPDSSIHKLCNYYNYTLSKATYRYAMKIDSDQIYFTDKLKRYCDAYRGMKEISRAKLILSRLLSFFIKVTSPYFLWKPQIVIRMYETCLFQRIMKEHMPLTLEGINLGLDINGWKVCFLQENDRKKSIFNGGGDHLIFEISEKTYYYTASDSNGNPIELMDCEEHINGGVFWYHLKGLKYPEQCTLFDFSILKNQTLDKSLYLFYPVFFSYEKECLPDPEDLLSEIKEKING